MVCLIDKYQSVLRLFEHKLFHQVFLDDRWNRIVRIDDVHHVGIATHSLSHAIEISVQALGNAYAQDFNTGIRRVSEERLIGRVCTDD